MYSTSFCLYVLAMAAAAVRKGVFKTPGKLESAVASSFGNMGLPQTVKDKVALPE